MNKIIIKASFLMDKDQHIFILKEKYNDFIKEFSFFLYENDLDEIIKKEDSKEELYSFLDRSPSFYEFLMYHNLECIHLHYLQFIYNKKEYTYFYSTENDYDQYWIDTTTYDEKWYKNVSYCYETEFDIDENNDNWTI